VQPVAEDEVSRYGIIDGNQLGERFFSVVDLVEKPQRDKAPSNLAVLGRYILTPRIFDILEDQKPGSGFEIQFSKLNEFEAVCAYYFERERYDVGEKLGFIKTAMEFATTARFAIPDFRVPKSSSETKYGAYY